jgi:hypothetical protein
MSTDPNFLSVARIQRNKRTFSPTPDPGPAVERRVWTIVFLLIASPIVVMILVVAKVALFDSKAALKRARALPLEQRQAILESCVRHSKSIKEDYEELLYDAHGKDTSRLKPIPPDFASLAAERVIIFKNHATISLLKMRGYSVSIHCEDLNTDQPSALLYWGEQPESEPWIAAKPGPDKNLAPAP